jgi:Exopolysaccharide biosynthesis protein related to N-acetylglucosamine-1-phosphodiester alpha-N-acetylglucosaminidase
MQTRSKNIYILLLFVLPAFVACKKDKNEAAEPKTFSEITTKIMENSSIMASVFSDTTFEVHPGVWETDIHYMNMAGLSTRLFILEADLNNPGVKMVAATPFDASAYSAQTVTEMSRYVDAPNNRVIAGFNGDFFNTTSFQPLGIVYKNGVAIKPAFTDNADKPQQGLSFLAVLKDGRPYIGDKDDDYTTVKTQIQEALGGGVFLVRDHKKVPQSIPTVEPRTGVGITDNRLVYFIVVDGRNFYFSNGINYSDMSQIFYALGASDAINLDGGGSSTFMIRHPLAPVWQVRNMPSDGSPRAVANSWLIISTTQP